MINTTNEPNIFKLHHLAGRKTQTEDLKRKRTVNSEREKSFLPSTRGECQTCRTCLQYPLPGICPTMFSGCQDVETPSSSVA